MLQRVVAAQLEAKIAITKKIIFRVAEGIKTTSPKQIADARKDKKRVSDIFLFKSS